jgi:anti-sigma28 factor (negative regulator of flagellin synthesis)
MSKGRNHKMQIHGVSQALSPQNVGGPQAARPNATTSTSRPQQAADQLEISPAAEAAVQAAEGGDVRADLVARVRSEIASGTYITPEKLDAALDRFLDESA